MEQEVNIDFRIEPQVDRDLLEPVINVTVDSTQEIMAKRPESIVVVSLSFSNDSDQKFCTKDRQRPEG